MMATTTSTATNADRNPQSLRGRDRSIWRPCRRCPTLSTWQTLATLPPLATLPDLGALPTVFAVAYLGDLGISHGSYHVRNCQQLISNFRRVEFDYYLMLR